MNIKPRLTIYIITCLTILFSSPNKGIWEQYDYNSGISSNYIFDVEKDEQDRIWVSTQNVFRNKISQSVPGNKK